MLGARDALNEGLETVQSRFDTGWGEYSEIGAIWDKQWAAGFIFLIIAMNTKFRACPVTHDVPI
ncbi:hypothetical protein GCM10027342_02690 [Photobacterium alginatilyticum]